MQLEIVFPVYNEEQNLEKSIITVISFLEKENLTNYNITISDNCSSDSTPEIALKLIDKYSKIRYLRTETKGVGAALYNAFKTSNAEIVGYMDIDLSTNIFLLKSIFKLFNNPENEIIIGNRFDKKSKVTRTLKRTNISIIYNLILKIFFFINFKDAGCGFKFFRLNSIIDLIDTISSNEWFFEVELLIKAEKNGLNIKELPVEWLDDTDSKVNFRNDILKILSNILNLKIEFLGIRKVR